MTVLHHNFLVEKYISKIDGITARAGRKCGSLIAWGDPKSEKHSIISNVENTENVHHWVVRGLEGLLVVFVQRDRKERRIFFRRRDGAEHSVETGYNALQRRRPGPGAAWRPPPWAGWSADPSAVGGPLKRPIRGPDGAPLTHLSPLPFTQSTLWVTHNSTQQPHRFPGCLRNLGNQTTHPPSVLLCGGCKMGYKTKYQVNTTIIRK